MDFQNLTLLEYANTKLAFTPCLFALPAYLAQTKEDVRIYTIANQAGEPMGIAPFVLRNNTAYNPPRATFGGWYGNILPANTSEAFWLWVQKDLNKTGTEGWEIKFPANAYLPMQPQNTDIQDLTYHIDLALDFELGLHHSEQRRLKKARKVNLQAFYWEKPDLAVVYQFVATARQRKGFPLTLTFEQFEQMFALFPNHYHVFAVQEAGKLASLTVTAEIDAQTLYNFYPADSSAYLPYSPTVLLLAYIANWAKTRNFTTFDLGIATEKGQRNEGLMRFKKNMGAIESKRYTQKALFPSPKV